MFSLGFIGLWGSGSIGDGGFRVSGIYGPC